MRRLAYAVLAGIALAACARQSDVRRVELQVRRMREETLREDSLRTAQLDRLIALQRQILDSLAKQESRLATFRGDIRADLTEVQRQLVQVQELTGQSQQRLSDLRSQIESRTQAMASAPRPADSTGSVSSPSVGPGPDQLYDMALQLLRKPSPQTARIAFQRLVQEHPAHARAPDAQFFIGESWGDKTNPDSAAAAYDRVVTNYPNSARVPTALFRLGQISEQKKDRSAARQYYDRLVSGYPRSEEAQLAREKLQALGR